MKCETELYPIFQKHPIVSTDSRSCPPNAIFFALKGENFDGNDYVEQVLEAGAAYAVSDRAGENRDERVILVDNVLQSLQDLAAYHRRQMPAQIIAITGSNGKTTTKELIANALLSKYKILYTQGNLNNHIGVPLTLLQLKPEHEYAVIEMGANHPLEIQQLCRIAQPDFGLITNVGKAHLEGFGSFEGVIRTKTELYAYLEENGGMIFENANNPILNNLYQSVTRITYGTAAENFIQGQMLSSSPTLSLDWKYNSENQKLKTHLVGAYNFENVLAAICIASYFGVEVEKTNRAIAEYMPSNNRSQDMQTAINHVIMDAYNANPSSMQAALENFKVLPLNPKMVILGEMYELGEYCDEEHRNIVSILQTMTLDKIFLVGRAFKPFASETIQCFDTTDEMLEYLQQHPLTNYHILIKGSRGNRLEKLIGFI